MKKKVIVAGGNGFIGSYICNILSKKGFRVFSLDNNTIYVKKPYDFDFYPNLNFRKNLLKNSKFYKLDITNYNKTRNLLNKIKPNYIIHLASLPISSIAIDDNQLSFNSILKSTSNLINASKKNKNLKSFVYISSSMVYGNFKKKFVKEMDSKNPVEIYGSYKYAGEIIAKSLCRRFDINLNIVRPSAVYGPGDNNKRIVSILLKNALKNKKTTLNNPKKNFLDFTYVEDTAKGIIDCMIKGKNQTFNITYGKSRSLFELLKISKNHFINLKYESVFKKQKFIPLRGTLNTSLAKKKVNYQPKYDLEKGIEKYVKFIKSIYKN